MTKQFVQARNWKKCLSPVVSDDSMEPRSRSRWEFIDQWTSWKFPPEIVSKPQVSPEQNKGIFCGAYVTVIAHLVFHKV